jgi:tRNA pseudouridine32 synthase / 23S rRNA pseudouridine746 synthase
MTIDIQSLVLYRDAMMLVLNKPANIAVHRGKGKGDFFDRYFHELCYGLPTVPALAHRLDRGTSGCLILGRHRQATAKLSDFFAKGLIQKTYHAVVRGVMPAATGVIAAPLRKKSQDPRNWWMEVHEEGLPSETRYEVLATKNGQSLVAFTPITGRTHQIRVHAAHLGCPIIGDYIYGIEEDRHLPRLLLHAASVVVPLYPKKDPIMVSAPQPADFWPAHILEEMP